MSQEAFGKDVPLDGLRGTCEPVNGPGNGRACAEGTEFGNEMAKRPHVRNPSAEFPAKILRWRGIELRARYDSHQS